jgi:hypothetical protein
MNHARIFCHKNLAMLLNIRYLIACIAKRVLVVVKHCSSKEGMDVSITQSMPANIYLVKSIILKGKVSSMVREFSC